MNLITKFELSLAAFLFVFSIVIFVVLHQTVGWPTPQDGWPTAVIVSATAAVLVVLPKYLSLIGNRLSSLEAFGVKINFVAAISGSKVGASTAYLVQRAMPTPESGIGDLERAAQEASEKTVFIIDLGDGHEWYWTRLFALAGMATLTGKPKLIVLIGQRARKPKQVGGSIRPADVMSALQNMDDRYAVAWKATRDELQRARSGSSQQYQYNYDQIGDLVVMRILVEHMRNQPQPLEPEPPTVSTWITLAEAEKQLAPWLVRQTVELNDDDQTRLKATLSSDEDIIIATSGGEFDGIVDVRRMERQVLLQMVTESRAQ
jgi:hypothetical protein